MNKILFLQAGGGWFTTCEPAVHTAASDHCQKETSPLISASSGQENTLPLARKISCL
jgi:hypothetical protein